MLIHLTTTVGPVISDSFRGKLVLSYEPHKCAYMELTPNDKEPLDLSFNEDCHDSLAKDTKLLEVKRVGQYAFTLETSGPKLTIQHYVVFDYDKLTGYRGSVSCRLEYGQTVLSQFIVPDFVPWEERNKSLLASLLAD